MYDAGIFLKNYIEYVEEVPNDIQKNIITKCRDLDCKTKNLVGEVQKICDKMTLQSDKKASVKMQQILVKITELKDEKIQLSQSLASHIENRYKLVADSFQNNVVKQERSPTPKTVPPAIVQQTTIITKQQTQNPQNSTSTVNITPECPENKPIKRIRKTRIDNLDVDLTDDSLLPPAKTTEKSVHSAANATKRGSSTNAAKKAKKRKTTKKQNAQVTQEAIDDIQEDGITDETTYCICQQISYGEMIFCENDTCPIEWFHFSCVDLTAKPKGRWFCPQCRGDKPNVINKNLRKKQQESSI